jgi:hypothetical protein
MDESVVTIEITSKDFQDALGKAAINRVTGKGEKRLGSPEDEGIKNYVARNLPRVLTKIMEDMIPKGFLIQSISFKVDVKGSPLGIGIDGSMTITMGPERK